VKVDHHGMVGWTPLFFTLPSKGGGGGHAVLRVHLLRRDGGREPWPLSQARHI